MASIPSETITIAFGTAYSFSASSVEAISTKLRDISIEVNYDFGKQQFRITCARDKHEDLIDKLLQEVSTLIASSESTTNTAISGSVDRLPNTTLFADDTNDCLGLESDGDSIGFGEDGADDSYGPDDGRIKKNPKLNTLHRESYDRINSKVLKTWRPASADTRLLNSTKYATVITTLLKNLGCTAEISHEDRIITLTAQDHSGISQAEASLNTFEQQLETLSAPDILHSIHNQGKEAFTARFTTFTQTPQKFHLTTLDETDPPIKVSVREYKTLRFYVRKAGQYKDAAVFKPWISITRTRKDPGFSLWANYQFSTIGELGWYENEDHIGIEKDVNTTTRHIPPDKIAAVKLWRAAQTSCEPDKEVARNKTSDGVFQQSKIGTDTPGPVVLEDFVQVEQAPFINQRKLPPSKLLTVDADFPPIAVRSMSSTNDIIPSQEHKGAVAKKGFLTLTTIKANNQSELKTGNARLRIGSSGSDAREVVSPRISAIARRGDITKDGQLAQPVKASCVQKSSSAGRFNLPKDSSRVPSDQKVLSHSTSTSHTYSEGLYEDLLLDDPPKDDGFYSTLYRPLVPAMPVFSNNPINVSTAGKKEVQRASKTSSEEKVPPQYDEDDVKVVESRQSTSEMKTRNFRNTMGQRGPSIKEMAVEKRGNAFGTHLESFVCETLERARKFRGDLNLQIDIGRILVLRCPTEASENYIPKSEMMKMLNEQSITSFTSILTESLADAEYILDLVDRNSLRLFEETPYARQVKYIFFCRREADTFIVELDGDTLLHEVKNNLEELGIAYQHHPKRAWDTRFRVSGQKAIADDEDIQRFTKKVYIPHGGTLLSLFGTTPTPTFVVENIMLSRETKHRSRDSLVSLQITEFQDLIMQFDTTNRGRFRAFSRDPLSMAEDHRLWYQFAVVPAQGKKVFEENKTLDWGSEAQWQPQCFVGNNVLKRMTEIASTIVEEIDNVGYHNTRSVSSRRSRGSTTVQSQGHSSHPKDDDRPRSRNLHPGAWKDDRGEGYWYDPARGPSMIE